MNVNQGAAICDTTSCQRVAPHITPGGFHFCDVHITDMAGRKNPPDVKVMSLRMPEATWERLREQAHVERTTITALILESIEYTHMWQSSGERA